MLKDAVPTIKRVAVLLIPSNPLHRPYLEQTGPAADALKLTMQVVEARTADDLDKAFEAAVERADAMHVYGDSITFLHRKRVAELALLHRLPTIFLFKPNVEAGGLLSYGPSEPDMYRRAATPVDKILRGREGRRSANRATHEVRAGHQPENRQGSRPDHTAVAAPAGGPGDRVMDRRAFFGTLGLLAAPRAAEAQSDQAVRKIGVINTNAPNRSPGLNPFFWGRMRELGWIEGKNFVVEFRDAVGGTAARGLVQSSTGEMVQLKVDIIVMNNGTAARRVQDVTRTIPICVFGGDLQQAGVIASLSRPGGNATGVQAFQPDLVGKRLESLKEVVPGLTRVGVLVQTRGGSLNTAFLRVAEDTGRTLQLQMHVVESPQPGDLEQAFWALTRGQARGLLVVNNPSITSSQSQVVALAAKSRLAAIYEYGVWTEAGVSCRMGRRSPTPTANWRNARTRSCAGPSRRTCPSSSPPGSNWPST